MTEVMNMWSEGELLVQCNSKIQTTEEKIKMGKSAAMAARSSFACCCRVPSQINWGFYGLSLRRLVDIQVSKTSKFLYSIFCSSPKLQR